MKFTVAIDSFKGSLSSPEAGEAAKIGILKVFPNADVTVRPLADGGEGTVDAVTDANGGEIISVKVCGPLCEEVSAKYGYIKDRSLAVIEMAEASGLPLIPPERRNPLYTTTFGVGQLILDALDRGVRDFIIGIGGSATNDGGVGMLMALGVKFTDCDGNVVPLGAFGLSSLVNIDISGLDSRIGDCTFRVACDVKNPLLGEKGCSAVFARQKGADDKMISDMDGWLTSYAALTKSVLPNSDPEFPGAGAAGGLGFALMSYLNGRMESGIDIVIETTGLEDYIKDSDFVITGEGRLDGQSYMGKAPIGVAKLGKKYGKTVFALCGSVSDEADICNEHGIDAFFPITRKPVTLEDAMNIDNAKANMTATAKQLANVIKSLM